MFTVDKISGTSKLKLLIYRRLFIPLKVFQVRRKRQIEVVFVISELGAWKTEALYKEMLEHPRFSPKIAVVNSTENPDAKQVVKHYLDTKGYNYASLEDDELIYDYFTADIIFYQKPYWWVIPDKHRYGNNYKSLFCFVTYGISTIKEKWAINQPIQLYAWQNYQFNDSCASEFKELSLINGKNFVVTGFPMTDSFTKYKASGFPWKETGKKLKKIIWAPHHTLPDGDNWLNYSTFLNYAQFMLDVAHGYSDRVQIAFKPHPLLKPKLDRLWGKEKADQYYASWENGINTQLVEGEYVDLFMQSDAMIHDCSSFIIEYLYTGKPILFLDNGSDHTANMLGYAAKAFNLQYKATEEAEIRSFIQSVLDGNDERKPERESFAKSNIIPSGESACNNIIKSILG